MKSLAAGILLLTITEAGIILGFSYILRILLEAS